MGKLTIRAIKNIEELKMIFEWAMNDCGWLLGLNDLQNHFQLGCETYRLLFLDDEPIGSIAVAKYKENFSFIGFFIVKKEHRSKGYGAYLWEETMKELGQQNLGLHGALAQVGRYEKSGFKKTVHSYRYLATAPKIKLTEGRNPINPENSTELKSITDYDQTIFVSSKPRKLLLEAVLKTSNVSGFVLTKTDETGTKVCGYGVIRPNNKGRRIGPVYADDFESAKELIHQLLNTMVGQEGIIVLDAPETKFTKIFAEYFNLTPLPHIDSEIMFKGSAPQEWIENLDKRYACLSLSLG